MPCPMPAYGCMVQWRNANIDHRPTGFSQFMGNGVIPFENNGIKVEQQSSLAGGGFTTGDAKFISFTSPRKSVKTGIVYNVKKEKSLKRIYILLC